MAPRSLLPREHGAYGQLAYPALSALVAGRPTWSSVALLFAAVAAFLGHEPLLVLLGRRGPRAKREDGARASRAFAASMVVATVGGAIAVVMSPLRWTLAPSAALGALVFVLVLREQEKTLFGELVVAAALSSLALPVGVLAGVAVARAFGLAAVWTVAFSLATVSVREAIRHAREPASRPRGPVVVPVAVAVCVATLAALGKWLPLALAPFLISSAVLLVAPPATRHLRRVGWSLIAASTVAWIATTML